MLWHVYQQHCYTELKRGPALGLLGPNEHELYELEFLVVYAGKGWKIETTDHSFEGTVVGEQRNQVFEWMKPPWQLQGNQNTL